MNSALPRISHPVRCEAQLSRMSGVLPIAARTSCLISGVDMKPSGGNIVGATLMTRTPGVKVAAFPFKGVHFLVWNPLFYCPNLTPKRPSLEPHYQWDIA